MAISAMIRAVAREATMGDADLVAPDRSSEPGRCLSDVGELIEVVLIRRPSLAFRFTLTICYDLTYNLDSYVTVVR